MRIYFFSLIDIATDFREEANITNSNTGTIVEICEYFLNEHDAVEYVCKTFN